MELKIPKKRAAAPAEEQKPVKAKKFKAKSGAKFVLFLGDEGAILIYLKGNIVHSRQFVPDASQENLREFRQTLSKDPLASLILVVDNMDQSYVQQTLPPVSSISVNKLIKRRLERDFGANDIKGAILLGRETSGRKDWNFLMVALEKSPQLSVWLEFIQELPNRFLGIYLLSVEAEMIVKRLEQALGVPKEGTGAEWKFFISHNKVGGFRQVILRNGRIMFTRLAQPVGESNAEVIAGSIEQEMLSTIEYMKRLSYTPQSKLDIYIITSSAIKAALDPTKFSASTFHVFTPYEVGQYLHIEGAAQPTDQFGDVVLAATVGSNRRHVLSLSAPQTRRVDQYYQYVMYQRVAAAMAICGVLIYAGYIGRDILGLMSDSDRLKAEIAIQGKQLEALRREIKNSNIDVEKASDLIDMYRQLQVEKFMPLLLIEKLQPATKSPVWIQSIDWGFGSDIRVNRRAQAAAGAAEAKPQSTQMTATIGLEFPQEASDPKMFRVVSKKVLADFKQWFQGYNVKYSTMPDQVTETDKIEIKSTATQKPEDFLPKSLNVQLIIRGGLSMFSPNAKPTDAPPEDAPDGVPPETDVEP